VQKEILSRLDEIQASIRDLKQASEKPMTLDEAATYLHASKSHTYQLTSKGLVAHFKPSGKKIFFRKSDLDAYLLRNRKASESELEHAAADHIVQSMGQR
jgi:excisionase family DNA binding protein